MQVIAQAAIISLYAIFTRIRRGRILALRIGLYLLLS
ncbi:hypothetical protein FPSE_10342 [Fusarium pseudograminearum CS3096]|uniref:Uncharacterized protein n=1 Tax=Fusarium pseudograminearum (strain CS3096) TaxID=1028729 RepID=K3V7J0_FUSPC|nr:hypothetical protein FPSE_10342 [Fusarium pseudograminearum CS3096]EKJ69482.1 hypothetical protein FPSE_10342 [Fusarium pseudograminearum CS3096]